MALIKWEGQPAILGMLTDITDRKLLEEDLKGYAQKIIQAQEEERKRIAYELHDDTAQYLSLLKLQLDSMLQSGKIQDPETIEKLSYLDKDASRAIDDVRRFSHELRPSVLDRLGLQAALEQIAEDINKLKQMKVELTIDGEEPGLSDNVKLALFRIVQEALNNARKHAQASKASVNILFRENQVKMEIKDNGTGFDIQEARVRAGKRGSLGLMSLQERASFIGAKLKIESEPGKGAAIRIEFPLEG